MQEWGIEISLSQNPGAPHKKSKHFGIEWAFFKESVEMKEITPLYVSTDSQPADMLTKSITSSKFVFFRDMIMGDMSSQCHFDRRNRVTHSVVDRWPVTQDRGFLMFQRPNSSGISSPLNGQ